MNVSLRFTLPVLHSQMWGVRVRAEAMGKTVWEDEIKRAERHTCHVGINEQGIGKFMGRRPVIDWIDLVN